MRVLGALLTVQARSAWNRVRRESGAAGPIVSLVVLAIVGLVLTLPALLMLRAGLALGQTLARGYEPLAMLQWNALQALFTLLFAALGGLRHSPGFARHDVLTLPIRPSTLLIAEMPAALFDAFPMLGVAGLVCSNLGLALRMPGSAPLILLLSLQGVAFMIGTLLLVSAAIRVIGKRRLWPFVILVVGTSSALVQLGPGWGGWGRTLRGSLPTWVDGLPGSWGYAGLIRLRDGEIAAAAFDVGIALLATGLLLLVAGAVYGHERGLDQRPSRSSRRRTASRFVFDGPADGVGRLFFRQLLDTRIGKVTLFLPLLLSGPLAIGVVMLRAGFHGGRVVPESLLMLHEQILGAPIYALFLIVIVLLDSQIWLNQFGWDRGGVRTLLLLPAPPRAVLLGKTFGLLRLVFLQSLAGLWPLLAIRLPGGLELVVGMTGAGVLLITGTAIGHWVSVRFPRAVDREGGANLPLYLSWIPLAVAVAVSTLLVLVFRAFSPAGPGGVALAFLVLLGLTVLVYLRLLPGLGRRMLAEGERLLNLG